MQLEKTAEETKDDKRTIVQASIAKTFICSPERCRFPALKPTQKIGDKTGIIERTVNKTSSNKANQQESPT
jgi:hypothetical protein